MSGKIHWCSDRVYCWKCGKLTPLVDTEWGLKPCRNCGADLLAWYLRQVGLRQATKEPRSSPTARKPAEPAQGGILPQKKAKEAILEG
jgi:hypothetical protein